jgi:hypothetical protein
MLADQSGRPTAVPIKLGPHRLEHFRSFALIAVAIALATAPAPARADWFGPVRYDPKGDQFIVTIMYDGTNPDHDFTIQWGTCRKLEQTRGQPERPGLPPHQIALSIVDNQGDDLAKKTYTTTITVPLATLTCRPARVSLLTGLAVFRPPTDPRSIMTLDIP